MTQTTGKTEPRWAEISEDAVKSAKAGHSQAIQAVSKFLDKISTTVPDQSRRKTIVDAALDMAEELHSARTEVARNVVRSASQAASKLSK